MKLFLYHVAPFVCLLGAALNVVLFVIDTSSWLNAGAAVICAGSLAIILSVRKLP